MTLDLQIGSYKTTFHLFDTTAPEAYDGFGTITIRTYENDGRTHRLVGVNGLANVAWQTGRYGSGLNPCYPFDPNREESMFWQVSERAIVDVLLKRLSNYIHDDE